MKQHHSRFGQCIIVAVALMAILALPACSGESPPAMTPSPAGAETSPWPVEAAGVWTLGMNGTVTHLSERAVRAQSVTVVPAAAWDRLGTYLAISPERRAAFVARPRPAESDIFMVDLNDGDSKAICSVTGVIRSIQLSRDAAVLYLWYNAYADARFAECDIDAGTVEAQSDILVRQSPGDWFILHGEVDSSETVTLISYHGANTQGADVLFKQEGGWRHCGWKPLDGLEACILAHGQARFLPGSSTALVLASGSSTLYFFDLIGGTFDELESMIADNHLMRFELADGFATVVGSCGYKPGLARIDLRTTAVEYLSSAICGELAESWNGRVVVAANRRPVPTAGVDGKLQLLDATTGLVTDLVVPSEIVSLAVAR